MGTSKAEVPEVEAAAGAGLEVESLEDFVSALVSGLIQASIRSSCRSTSFPSLTRCPSTRSRSHTTPPLEAQAGESTAALNAMTLGAFLLRFRAEVLNFFEFMAALGAAIRIQRQGVFLSGYHRSTSLLYRLPHNSLQSSGKPTKSRGRLPAQYCRGEAGPCFIQISSPWRRSSRHCGLSQLASIRLDRDRRRVVFPRERQRAPAPVVRIIVYTRSSTIAGGAAMFIFVLPRSLDSS